MSDFSELNARAGLMFQELLRRTHLSAARDVAGIVAEEARIIGVANLVVYLIDYEHRLLVPVAAPDAAGREPLPVLGTVAGRAFTSTSILPLDAEGGPGRRVWLPLLDGTERLGVIDAWFPKHVGELTESLVPVV